ncbi:thiol:disulfide interchange protein DsbA/DsbL [Massilia sp. R2A-15]|uniref:thiol:disulfide interchange protein DsbA/DsbL n=1 Tax=Massilia sp. R2A-15 TaxID=3064278 RepID=UPI00273450D8|nr:thiol:disulfide interchange protein DsbA/DsbL [Massilia sp. R2A-15]WLI88284.1 thiol:disulfide interchange protein DsbA/DsbL [Massilia sp. R2A-15]
MLVLRLALAAIGLVSTIAFASPNDPRNGAEFVTLPQKQDVKAPAGKVEVLEFFMYHCPYCHQLEPELAAWVKKQGNAISFRRVHVPYTGAADPEAHLFLTLEAMGKGEAMFPRIEHAVHVEHIRLAKDDAIIDWVGKNGIDRNQFLETWNSFGVMTAMKRLPRTISDYRLDGSPSLVVNGRYVTSPAQAGSRSVDQTVEAANKAVITVLDVLVAKAQAENAAR